MQAPCITLHSTTQSSFRHNDGYEGVSITELEILLRQGREVTTSLEGELMKRHHDRTSDQPGELGRCCERLHNTVRELSVKERLDDRAAKQVDDAVEILTTSQTASSSKTYQAFLYDILRHCSPSLVLLCAASLGKKRIIDIGLKVRVSLLAYVRDTQLSLDSSVLKTLANEYGIPSSDSPHLTAIMAHPLKRSRHAEVTADVRQEEAAKQSQSIEDGHLAPVQTSLLSGEGHPTHPLTGDVYNLTIEDARAIATSDQIQGQTWLTIPYNQGSAPFITISISRFLSFQFAGRLAQIM